MKQKDLGLKLINLCEAELLSHKEISLNNALKKASENSEAITAIYSQYKSGSSNYFSITLSSIDLFSNLFIDVTSSVIKPNSFVGLPCNT